MIRARLIGYEAPLPGWFNMAADHFLAESNQHDNNDFTIRFYSWHPAAVSLGCNQNVGVVNLNRCKKLGWDVVLRPTGGRTLLHAGDLSYSVIVHNSSNPLSKLKWLYSRIETALSKALERVGLEPDANFPKPAKPTAAERALRKDLCMTSLVRGEITASGRKIAGAAQHVYQRSILQHGSIALKVPPSRITEIMAVDDKIRSAMQLKLQAESCSLSEIGVHIEPDALAAELAVSIAESLMADASFDPLRPHEIEEIESMQNKFELYSVEPKVAVG